MAPASENLATVREALDWQRDEGYLEALAALDALEQELAWAVDKTWGITQMLLGVEAERDAAFAQRDDNWRRLCEANDARDAAQAELAQAREALRKISNQSVTVGMENPWNRAAVSIARRALADEEDE